MRSLLLVHMPMADSRHPNLGMEQLAAKARAAGEQVYVLYGNLLMPPVRADIGSGLLGDLVFAPLYFGVDPEETCDKAADCLLLAGEQRDQFRVALLSAMYGAELCIRRCLAQVAEFDFDVAAFSVCFDNQKLASASLARELKQLRPSLRIVFGGTGCDGNMALGVLAAFPEVDASFRGAAVSSLVDVLAHVRGQQSHAIPPAGLQTRQTVGLNGPSGDSAIDEGRLHRAPAPDYNAFLAQRAAAGIQGELRLLFETSRGCWWGRKSHCSFCGIAAIGNGYGSVTTEEAHDIILSLRRRWRPDLLYSTDAIMDTTHIATLTPLLATYRERCDPDLRIFYELKTNLKRSQVAALAAAGITEVQPGIESFSTKVLAAMRKGCTGIQQIAFLKWARTYDMRVAYGLMLGTPLESEGDIALMAELCPRLHHLPPPVGLGSLSLHRFSPYVNEPEKHGIATVKPYALQRLAYRVPPEVLNDLCYEFDFTLQTPRGPRYSKTVALLHRVVSDWRRAYFGGAALTVQRFEDFRLIVRRSRADSETILWLDGPAAAVLDAIETPRSVDRIGDVVDERRAEVERLLSVLEGHGLAICLDGLWLTLAVPIEANAMVDAGFADSGRRPRSQVMSQVAS